MNADASRHWEPAASIAGRIAQASRALVTVITAERVRRRQADVLRRAEQVLGLPRDQVELLARPGLVEQVVPEAANAARVDLLVLGPLGGLDWLTHRHILGRLVDHVEASTLVVRGEGKGFTKALVATEGGRHGFADAEAALALARVFPMEVHALHVLSQVAIYDYIKEHPDVEFLESDHPAAKHLRELRAMVARAGCKGDAKVRVGAVQDEVLGEVGDAEADLLVIGTHMGEEDRFLARDLASGLLRHCSVSTLVARGPLGLAPEGQGP